MEALHLVCGGRRPQLKRNPLGSGIQLVLCRDVNLFRVRMIPSALAHVRRLRVAISLVLSAPLLPSGCRNDVVDDWGPPAGFGAVAGVIRDSSATPKPNILVAVSSCEEPLGGFLGEASSDQEGRYRVDGSLAPIGLLPSLNADTVRLHCVLFVGPRGAPLVTDTVTVPFSQLRSAVVPTIRDIALP